MATRTALIKRARALASLPPPDQRRAIREAAGASLADVSTPLGVTPQAVRLWELGQRTPRGNHLLDYLDLLNDLKEAST